LVDHYRVDDALAKRFAVIVLLEKVVFGVGLVALHATPFA